MLFFASVVDEVRTLKGTHFLNRHEVSWTDSACRIIPERVVFPFLSKSYFLLEMGSGWPE